MSTHARGPLAIPDEQIVDETGRSSADWAVLLDAWGAPEKGHTATVAELQTVFGLGERWAHIVAIRYEAARGLQGQSSVPADLVTALILKPTLRIRFEQMDVAEQRAISRWIEAAEDKPTRTQRVQETVRQLGGIP